MHILSQKTKNHKIPTLFFIFCLIFALNLSKTYGIKTAELEYGHLINISDYIYTYNGYLLVYSGDFSLTIKSLVEPYRLKFYIWAEFESAPYFISYTSSLLTKTSYFEVRSYDDKIHIYLNGTKVYENNIVYNKDEMIISIYVYDQNYVLLKPFVEYTFHVYTLKTMPEKSYSIKTCDKDYYIYSKVFLLDVPENGYAWTFVVTDVYNNWTVNTYFVLNYFLANDLYVNLRFYKYNTTHYRLDTCYKKMDKIVWSQSITTTENYAKLSFLIKNGQFYAQILTSSQTKQLEIPISLSPSVLLVSFQFKGGFFDSQLQKSYYVFASISINYENFETPIEHLARLMGNIANSISGGFSFLSLILFSSISTALSTLLPFLNTLLLTLVASITDLLVNLLIPSISTLFTSLYTIIAPIVSLFFQELLLMLEPIFTTLLNLVYSVVNWLLENSIIPFLDVLYSFLYGLFLFFGLEFIPLTILSVWNTLILVLPIIALFLRFTPIFIFIFALSFLFDLLKDFSYGQIDNVKQKLMTIIEVIVIVIEKIIYYIIQLVHLLKP